MTLSRYVALSAMALAFWPAVASAEDAVSECACLTAYQGQGAPIGSVVSSTGAVKVSQAAGYADATKGSPLSFGSRVIVGPQSSAQLKVGSDCNVNVSQNSTADLSRLGDKICVKLQLPEKTASYGAPGDERDNRPFGFPEAFATVVALTTIGGYVFDTESDGECVSGPDCP